MRSLKLAAVVALSMATTAPVFAAPSCITPTEARAMQVRQLHIQLQVASLNCRADDPSLPAKYSNYVTRFDRQLSENAQVLRGHFAKQSGKQANRDLDRYMTVLANAESQRAHIAENYCETHVPLFENLLSLKPNELESFASRTMDSPGRSVCSESKQVVAKAKTDTKPAPQKAAKTDPKAQTTKPDDKKKKPADKAS